MCEGGSKVQYLKFQIPDTGKNNSLLAPCFCLVYAEPYCKCELNGADLKTRSVVIYCFCNSLAQRYQNLLLSLPLIIPYTLWGIGTRISKFP